MSGSEGVGDGVGTGVGVAVGEGTGVGDGVGSGVTVGTGDGVGGTGVTGEEGEEQAPTIITPVIATHTSAVSLTVTTNSLLYETRLNFSEELVSLIASYFHKSCYGRCLVPTHPPTFTSEGHPQCPRARGQSPLTNPLDEYIKLLTQETSIAQCSTMETAHRPPCA